MHHPIASHDGQHIDAVCNRLTGHGSSLGEVTTQQDP
jgi:hypothetical protein